MASKKQRQDALKKREKRSKMLLIAAGVAFLALAVYEVPTMLALMNKKPPPGTTYDPGPSSVVPGSGGAAATALPNVAGATAAPTASKGDLVDTDVPPASTAGQLVTFEVFQTKNPFAPQVTATTATTDTSGAATTANKPGADVPANPLAPPTLTTTTPTLPGQSLLPGTTTPTTPATTTTTAAPPPTVSISVNGVVSKVSTNGTFPSGAPVFRLASYGHTTAQIGIVGGSYQAGGQTITLQQGVPITLQNTTDGKQYKIELLSTP
jgi:hypothetical protein